MDILFWFKIKLVSVEVYEKHLARSVRLAEKGMSNTFHCQTADCAGWAVVEDNLNIFRCPVCRKTNCLTCQVKSTNEIFHNYK